MGQQITFFLEAYTTGPLPFCSLKFAAYEEFSACSIKMISEKI